MASIYTRVGGEGCVTAGSGAGPDFYFSRTTSFTSPQRWGGGPITTAGWRRSPCSPHGLHQLHKEGLPTCPSVTHIIRRIEVPYFHLAWNRWKSSLPTWPFLVYLCGGHRFLPDFYLQYRDYSLEAICLSRLLLFC